MNIISSVIGAFFTFKDSKICTVVVPGIVEGTSASFFLCDLSDVVLHDKSGVMSE